jgi:23S rRNA (guanosine2251-2'-O)-methyltransferase
MTTTIPKLSLLLDRVRSAYNVGSIFRSAESAGVDKIYLGGYCAIPPNPKLLKTALGSYKTISWEHHCSALSCAKYLKSQGIHLIALETVPNSVNIFTTVFNQDSCLIVGHEESGIDQAILDICDEIITIPHYGAKDSLNVAVAAGVAVYEYRRKTIDYLQAQPISCNNR